MSFNKKTTNQLSDQQMGELTETINSAAAANKPAPVDLSGIMSGIGTLNTGQGGINTNIAGVDGKVTTGFSDLQSLINAFDKKNAASQAQLAQNQMTGFSDLNTMNQGRADVLGQQLTGVGGDVTQGFADQTTRFDTLDTSIGDVQTGVNTANTGIETMGKEMGNRFDTTDTNFSDAGKALDTGFTDTQGDIATLQTEALKGQSSILDDLATQTTDRNTYFDTLSGNQDTMLGNQEQYSTTFDDYVTRYTDDTSTQNDTLGGIQSGLTNFAGDVTGSLSGLTGAVNQGAQDTKSAAEAAAANSAGSVSSILEGGFNNLEGGFATLEKGQNEIASTLGDGFNQDQSSASQILNQLQNFSTDQENLARQQSEAVTGQLKSLSQLSGLPDTMRQQFGQLSNAFDDQGNLIQNSIDDQGNTIVRAMDNQGNMILRKFDATGTSMGQMSINMNTVMDQIGQLNMLPGASAGMGNLSQPLQDLGTGNGGFVSPYGRTQ
jgi:hypothetical protein